jgi:hypothetical protein
VSWRFLQRLHRNDQGQVVPLFMLGVLALVLLVVMVLNTGEQITTRMRVQDAADAAAITQATWVARSLNVLSMNNVAITQAAALVIITEALIPPLAEASKETLLKYKENLEWLQQCSGTGWLYILCAAPPLYRLYHLSRYVAKPLWDIWDDNPFGIMADFTAIAQALEDMNETVVNEFPDFTAGVARALARDNGLGRDAPLFLAGYRRQDEQRYDTTTLPVEKVTLSHFRSPLCISGEYGTPQVPQPSFDVRAFETDFYANRNFAEHGYPRDQGPYTIGRDSANRAISRPVDALRGFPHYGQVNLDFLDLVEKAWAAACQFRIVGFSQIDLYRVQNQPLPGLPVGEKRHAWSLLAFTRKPQVGAAVLPRSFANPPQALYAYAQAEIYNTINYDLYTQDWHAKLVPARLLRRERKEAVMEATAAFPTLRRLLEGMLDEPDFAKANLH